MSTLSTADFAAFFEAVWGVEPFAWQTQLLEHVDNSGRWPELVDIPTGLGKTATIDIALFALAIEATTEPDRTQWRHPHRIVMVVDRRVVVDQAHDRASALLAALEDEDRPEIVERVRTALLARSATDGPEVTTPTPTLLTSVLRGGIVRDEAWARRPDVPAVLASTVDQVGSRLLFRGYGLSTGARPIHAGLLGSDTLFLLDEVHLAQPFAETLAAVQRHGAPRSAGLPQRMAVAQLTATPIGSTSTRFPTVPLGRPDTNRAEAATTAGGPGVVLRRIGSSKPADLIAVKVPADASKSNETFAKAAAKEVTHRLGAASRVAVMVNRVDTARRVANHLAELLATPDEVDVVLLTGRMRPADRTRVLQDITAWRATAEDDGTTVHRLAPGPRREHERPIVVVATQSLEAGADFDFDCVVTECASLDALRQRFGRVDRDGQRWMAGKDSRSAILCRSTDISGKAEDPVYGGSLTATWKWLEGQPEVDFGYRAMTAPTGDDLRPLLSPRTSAPLLAASHLDRWARTSERRIAAEPEPAQWLHGIHATDEIAEVQLVWRADLDPSLCHWNGQVEDGSERRTPEDLSDLVGELLTLVPPLAAEAMAVPIGEARRWLRHGTGDPSLADAPMESEPEDQRGPRRALPPRLVARWIDGGVVMVPPEQIRPGDTVVIPATAGGISRDNWDPSARATVADLSPELSLKVRGHAVTVLTPDRCTRIAIRWPDPTVLQDEPSALRRETLRALVDGHREDLGLPDTSLRGRREIAVAHKLDGGRVVRSYAAIGRVADAVGGDDLDSADADDALSLIGRPMRLANHLRGVGDHAQAFASALGWSDSLVATLRFAGDLHDAGKIDSRFQAILAGGSPVGAHPLAKSARNPGTTTGRRVARQATGYPSGARHELLSLAMIADLDPTGDIDWELAQYLVATHHGWGRYRFRPAIDRRPERVTLDVDVDIDVPLGTDRDSSARGARSRTVTLSADTDHGLLGLGTGHSDRYGRLTRRYGWWTLAQMEAILRLADHRRSYLEQRGQVEDGAAVVTEDPADGSDIQLRGEEAS